MSDAPVEVIPRSRPTRDRIPVTVKGPRTSERLTLLWAGEGWPSDVETVLADASDPWQRELVVVARHFSTGALRRLRERDANWVDEAGDARIIGPSGLLVLRKEERPSTSTSIDTRPFAWSPSAVAVAEVILARSNKPILNRELSKLTEFSLPQISRTLVQFDKRGWTRKVGTERGPGGRRDLEDADALLRAWSGHVAGEPRPAVEAHAVFKDALTFVKRDLVPALERRGRWGLSGWAALELAAPFATQVPTVHVYVEEAVFNDSRIEHVLAAARLRSVDEGGRVIFWPADTTALRLSGMSERRGLPIVSAPRLYADLNRLGGRGVDAAEHVRETLIEF